MPTLHWVGKDKVVNHHHDVPFRLLNKQYTFKANEGAPANSTANRIIHGDNLEALKSLLPEFEGKVNCIYIDPPYNTGNEGWVYNDSVNNPKIKKWLGQVVGKEGEDLSRHDKWLCMMYPRLKLLHRLLDKSGVIFVSLDENEITHFRAVMNEVFGESNFLAQIIVQSNKRGQTYKQIAKTHEYLLCFGKSSLAELGELSTEGKNLPEKDKFGSYSSRELRNRNPKFGRFNRPNLFYPIYVQPGIVDDDGNYIPSLLESSNSIAIEPFNSEGVESCWRWGKEKFQKNTVNGSTEHLFARQTRDGGWRVFEKYRKESVKAKSIWFDTKYISEQGTTELGRLGLGAAFEFPKPVDLILDCLELCDNDDAIVLDTFAGSGTTAHAVLKLNAQDGGNRRFILCEMMDYAETITAERVRRVVNGYGEGSKALPGTGGSFDYYTVGPVLFNEDKNLNEEVGEAPIRAYVAYTESIPPAAQCDKGNPVSQYALGASDTALWLFYYEPDRVTTLNLDFLASLNIKALPKRPEHFVIYADKCALDKDFLYKHGITFKRIPRDITRF
ncbi:MULTISPECIES: site-specific DNA-methyltransferase [Pseudomonas]|uniref:site-specific DNA-methyltransferase n=1 Tax=Pseudomonas TaxID=286 RepID=UPI0013202EA3|nr:MULTISPECIES: site-specific DNA-methyltransferase [Pseudomonas]QHD09135.1 type III restriction endonuclease subunit M [Pseudomonas sp. R76]WPN22973.1 site-specific DNA-methyltransferase [Pseudomonas marginalis]